MHRASNNGTRSRVEGLSHLSIRRGNNNACHKDKFLHIIGNHIAGVSLQLFYDLTKVAIDLKQL